MIDFIPLHSYAWVVNTTLLVATLLLALFLTRHTYAVVEHTGAQNKIPRVLGVALLIALCVLIGLRPINGVFGDMKTYYRGFLVYVNGASPDGKDMLFEWLMWAFAQLNAPELFFLFCSLVYLLPLALASKRVLNNYWALGFFFIIANYSFYGFAVNGIRNGMAMSMFILSITYTGWWAWVLMGVAIGFHGSLALPVIAYVATKFNSNVKYYMWFWVACLFISTIFPGVGALLAGLFPSDNRLEQYASLEGNDLGDFSGTGFRFDFLIYSFLPIAVGLLYRWRGVRFDRFYSRIFNVYLFSNAVWLLLIRIPFSNRFAYLSWGFMGLVIAYPLIKWKLFKQQQIVFAVLLAVFSGFSYFYQS